MVKKLQGEALSTAGSGWFFGACGLLLPIVLASLRPSPEKLWGAEDFYRVTAWLVSLAGITALFIWAGFELKGRALGVLIDERNKYSLSRLQMTLWSVIVLASIHNIFIFNLFRTEAGSSLNVNLDWNLIVLMGISVVSFIASPIALSRKTSEVPDASVASKASVHLEKSQSLDGPPTAKGTIVRKQRPADARIADLIRGEEVGNATVVDISRTQMLIMTIVVILAYAIVVLKELATGASVVTDMPTLHQTLLGLIFVSHASYIGGKMTPTTAGAAREGTASNLARSLQLSQRATDLVRDIEAKQSRTASPQSRTLEDSLTLARAAAAEAAGLPTRATTSDFNPDQLAVLEGRLDALRAMLGSITGSLATDDISNAPSEQKVKEVQRKLIAQGHTDVTLSGVPDAMTEQAIRIALERLGVSRTDLHPRAYKYYEELAQMLD